MMNFQAKTFIWDNFLARGSKSVFWDFSAGGSKSLDKHFIQRFVWVPKAGE
jgi:hypothetical protein